VEYNESLTMQNLSTLGEISLAHQGKVSDKWSSYLDEYQRLFCEYQDRPVSLLEIGIQNGGSLEIWSKYFANARALIGCDINEKCRALTFEDARIAVIVGDANSDPIQSEVLERSADFDLIIDDGSHTSGDIVKSFARYFPRLNAGGIFLAEDLHCSYWRDFEGGLFDPLSSIAFFKDLADIVNHEHWGIPEKRTDLLDPFRAAYGVDFAEADLAQIRSVEFLNSICVVRKNAAGPGGLGIRRLAGTSAEVFVPAEPGTGSGTKNLAPDQSGNTWSQPTMFQGRAAAANAAKEISDLNLKLGKLAKEIEDRQAELVKVAFELNQSHRQIDKLKHTLALRESSMSWKLTAPLRAIQCALTRR
jgi:hypothetical protein